MRVLRGAAVWIRPGVLWDPAVVTIDDGRIVAVERGTRLPPAPNTSEVVDLSGHTLLPGFQDAHVHPAHGGLRQARCDLTGISAREGYLEAIARYAQSHPDRLWITGGGWKMPHFPAGTPRCEDLDGIVADRPVYLVNADGHGAWVNTAALERARVHADTPDPIDGRIERDADGTPTGTLHEGAMELVSRLIPPPSPGALVDAIEKAQRHLHALGITAWTDAWVVPEELGAYQALADAGRLTARVTAALWWERHRGLEQIDDLVAQRVATRGDRLAASTVKIMQDGVIENGTAAMLDPYLDLSGMPTANKGLSYLDPEILHAAVAALDHLGFQVHVHAIGDRGVREALDAFAAVRATNENVQRRHTIAHLQVVHPDDISRFAELGVIANAQPYWAMREAQMVDLTLPVLGPQRSDWQYPWASLVGTGARLAFGSDWPVSTPDPLAGIDVAMHRADPNKRGTPPFLPAERLSLDAAIAAATTGSAYLHHLEKRTGLVAPGMAADLAVVDAPLFGPHAMRPADASVVLTMVGGEVVHRTI